MLKGKTGCLRIAGSQELATRDKAQGLHQGQTFGIRNLLEERGITLKVVAALGVTLQVISVPCSASARSGGAGPDLFASTDQPGFVSCLRDAAPAATDLPFNTCTNEATDEPWRCTSGMVRDRSKHPVMPLAVAWFLGLHTAQGTDEEDPGQTQAM
ncbi:hypothetical protein Anapl_02022 [Anas platyrhynchos]|uniref:Uncharacterized protein n=1 Tax=Anas platyrhynchos TaxID=8839 RepID=R0M079_ANAPL|nr:hypothetical protein Anapl_02022 [Anas platyrhynchos]